MASKPKPYIDPNDGLPVAEVGEWAREKHARLEKYVDACWAARRKYVQWGRCCAYVDLFCGPGRSVLRESGEVVDGSAVLAYRKASSSGIPFGEIHIGDLEPANVYACRDRLQALGCKNVVCHVGAASETAGAVATALDPGGLHIAFLDPFNLLSLPLSLISKLARLEHIDFILHVSQMDFQRNIRRYAKDGRLSQFVPGWQDRADERQKDTVFRHAVLEAWKAQLAELRFDVKGTEFECETSNKNVGYYWLAYLSRNPLGTKLWNEIRSVQVQRSLI